MTSSRETVSMAAQEIEYVELYTTDQSAVLDYYIGSLGFTRVAMSARNAMNSVLLRQGKVQLIVTSGPGTGQFLDEHGDGIADIALNCDDVAAVADAAVLAGAKVHTAGVGHPVAAGRAQPQRLAHDQRRAERRERRVRRRARAAESGWRSHRRRSRPSG